MQVKQDRVKGKRGFYLIGSLSFLLTLLLAAAMVYFWEEIQQAKVYSYTGGFLVSILGGITVIPVPSLLVIFMLGHRLNPVYVGLVSGLGEALGGITTYLTGAGVETVWSKLRSREPNSAPEASPHYNIMKRFQTRLWSQGESFYNRLTNRVGRRGGVWVVLVTSAIPLSPAYYFAGVAAGSLKMGLLRFFLVSWAGKTIRGMIIAIAGYEGLYWLLRWIGM